MSDWFVSFALLMLGGGAGANARYWLGKLLGGDPGAFPWATFAINVGGSVALGALAALCLNPDAPRKYWYLLLGTGFCGGFTTFSTFSLETVTLLHAGRTGTAAAYVLGSVAAGVLGAWLALKLAGGKLG
ncbi:MAG: fluoride efflux transporter CrcB [Planctomycetes bacterium]|nr:fluoride efflux transporter CrcB [Planctomycetota bacterium]